MQNRTLLRRVWEGFLDSLGVAQEDNGVVDRSIGMGRLREQLWSALDTLAEEGGDWAYPLDIFVGDDGSSLFSIVAQAGKLFQVPMTISQDNLALGEWKQVTEVFQPVTQSRFSVKRQKDGKYRWLCIAGTTVLNRVGEIDSSELFDSFVKQANEKGKYPRLDFYHLGESDPKKWEFGTADYLAREGVCYIASGTFDEDHPLARAAIKACESGSDIWGNSIEFYAYAEPEIILLDPKIQVPIYKEGENTRISLVLEEDAAGLFTRMLDINERNTRTMDSKIEEVLKKLFGDDETALNNFVETVDTVNRTVKNDKLIHRKKDDPKDPPPEDDDDTDEDADDTADDDTTGKPPKDVPVVQSIDLDAEGLQHLAKQLIDGGALAAITQSVADLTAIVAELKIGRENDNVEIARLKKANNQLAKKVETLAVEDTEKKTQYLQDLPSRRHTQATYRPKEEHAESEDDEFDSEVIAKRTLATLPNY